MQKNRLSLYCMVVEKKRQAFPSVKMKGTLKFQSLIPLSKFTIIPNSKLQTFAICGAIRRMGQSDDSIYRLARESGLAK